MIRVPNISLKNIGSFGICSKAQKSCKSAVQKWLNGKNKTFDINIGNIKRLYWSRAVMGCVPVIWVLWHLQIVGSYQ